MSDEKKPLNLSGIFENGYGYIPKAVMVNKNLSIEAKGIYAYLATYMNDEDNTSLSVDLVCSQLNISEKKFYKYKNGLIANGYL